MSLLVILHPPQPRLASRAAADGMPQPLPTAWPYVFSADGRSVAHTGTLPTDPAPRADQVVLVLAEPDVSWHRIDIPKAPAARLRAALAGVLEDTLLDDDDAQHLALAAGSGAGAPGWVAATHKPRLAAALAALEFAGVAVDRVVAAASPPVAGAQARGHFFTLKAGDEDAPWLSLAREGGVTCLRAAGGLLRALPIDTEATRWTATPAAAAAAERWLGGAPVALQSDAERALEAASSPTNLRQFDLAARHRGTRALRDVGKRLLSAEWRPVRVGAAVLVAVNLVGLNAWAWQQRQAVQSRRAEMDTLLKTSHPGVRVVLSAPQQMQRETERLRTAAGRAGDADLEALLGAAAAAWPDGQGPAQTLRYEAGRLTLAAPGFGEPQMAQLRERLKGSGYVAELAEGRVTLSRQAAA